jgi:hypothetical protein
VPSLEEASEGYSFNWDKILSDNIAKEISDYRAAGDRWSTNGLLHVSVPHGRNLFYDSISLDELELEHNLP